jgi:small-conductance mechanosensitive channel
MKTALLALWVTAFAAVAQAADETSATDPATLVLWNRPVMTFRATVEGVPPRQRVRNAESRLAAVPSPPSEPRIGTRPGRVGSTTGTLVVVEDHVIFGVVDADPDPEGELSVEQVAAQAVRQLQQYYRAREEQRRVPALARAAGLSLLALIGLILVLKLIRKARLAATGRIVARLAKRPRSIGGIDILPTLATVERATFLVLSWALGLGLSYVALAFILHQFPYTEPLGLQLGDYLAARLAEAAKSVAGSLPSLVAVAAVLLITRAISLWVSRVFAEAEHGLRKIAWLEQEQARATRRIASGIVWVLGVATAYPLLPWSDSRAFQGMSVVLGLAVSFASGGLINHWVSGLAVLYARSVRVGEFVSIGGVEGVVTELGALATKLRTMRQEEVSIPNAVMASDKLVNYTRLAAEKGLLVSISMNLGYEVAWQQVRELTLVATRGIAGVRQDVPPRLLPWELAEFYVRYQLHVPLEPGTDRIAARAEVNSRILDAFGAAGVQIMTPHYEHQPEKAVVPAAAWSRP